MATCYLCGISVTNGTGYRRRVYTGDSSRIYFGRRVSTSFGQQHGIRTLCYECTIRHDKENDRENKLIAKAVLWLVGIGFIFIYIFPSCSRYIMSSKVDKYTEFTGSAVMITRASLPNQVNQSTVTDTTEPGMNQSNIRVADSDYNVKYLVSSNDTTSLPSMDENSSNDYNENLHTYPYQSVSGYNTLISSSANQLTNIEPNINSQSEIYTNKVSPQSDLSKSSANKLLDNTPGDPRGVFSDMN